MTSGVIERFAKYSKSKELAALVDASDKTAVKAAVKDLSTMPLLAAAVDMPLVEAPWPGP
eukprot:CAMPEP_0205928190 /NCGR_PEP_ID=MMETSP1325-20131115/24235_1 /ASSEMBLY_ACC=CAM_ASM_000708 /TAXON_ID=236786 /ORGANISM="Florenciella sp., Strain RCC1007" /LENGTH=59 /DNA_ID=CAMNT_0053297183 /DNA_START=26 /DNA_END=202 /DNA_ORIENTATION=-